MKTKTDDFLNDLAEFDATTEARGYDLRLDLSEIIVRHLGEHGLTQKQLAERAGMKEPFVTRLIHSANNCTFDTAGRILFALGIKARLVEEAALRPATTSKSLSASTSIVVRSHEVTHGKEKDQSSRSTDIRLRVSEGETAGART